jgi:hypothetical protein
MIQPGYMPAKVLINLLDGVKEEAAPGSKVAPK